MRKLIMSKKLNREENAAILSIRAKARKALKVEGVAFPKNVQQHLESGITWADKKLPQVKEVKSAPAEVIDTQDDGGAYPGEDLSAAS